MTNQILSLIEPYSEVAKRGETSPVSESQETSRAVGISPDGYKDGDSVTVRLSAGRVAIIDTEDLDRVLRFKWSAHPNGTGQVYAARYIDGKYVYLHRFLLSAPPSVQVDHINGDTLDCRKSNLRLCTGHQNNINRRSKPNQTGYRGVTLRRSGKWRAKVKFDGKSLHIGLFPTPELAAIAYDDAARRLHGEFARLNFPEKPIRRSDSAGYLLDCFHARGVA